MQAPPGAERRGRRLLGWLGVAAAAVLLAYAGLAVLLRTAFDPASVAAFVEPRLSAALNRPVSLDGVRLALFPRLGVELVGLRVDNPEGLGDLPLASLPRVELRPRLLPLLRRRIVVDRIRLEGPRVLLVVTEAGVSNFGDFVPAREEGAGDGEAPVSSLSFDLRRFELRGGRIGYRDAERGRTARLTGLTADGSVSRARQGWSVAARVGADSAVVLHPSLGDRERTFLALGLRASTLTGPRFEWVEIRGGVARLGRVEASLEGRVDSLKTPVRRVDLRLASDSIPLGDALASLPPRLRERLGWEADGALALRLAARGALGEGRRPDLAGEVAVRRGRLARPGGPELARALDLRATLAGDSLGISRLRGEVLGGPLALDGTVWLDSARRFSLRVAATPSLARFSEWRPREGVTLTGTVELELGLGGRFSDLRATRGRGRVGVRDVRVTVPSLLVPVEVPSGRLDVTGEEARWSDFVVVLGEDRLTSSGTARDLFDPFADPPGVPTLSGTLNGRRLLADRVFPAPPDSIGYGKLVFARLGNRRIEGRTAEEIARERDMSRPTSIPARGELAVRLDTLRWLPYRMTGFSGVLRFSPERVELTDADFRMFGGAGRGGLAMGIGPDAVEPFRMALRVEEARADELLSASSPLRDVLSGTLTLDLATEGGLDSLFLPPRPSVQGDGRIAVADGVFTPGPVAAALASFLGLPDIGRIEFSRWEAPFTIREGTLHVAGGRIDGRLADWEFTGAVGLGGGLDLGVSVRLSPERAREISPTGGGTGAEFLRGLLTGGRPLDIGLRIGGDVWSPRISLDPSALGRGVAEAAREEVERRVEREVERRIEGELGLTPGEADSAPAGDRILREGQRRLEEEAGGLLRGLLGRDTAKAGRDTTGGR